MHSTTPRVDELLGKHLDGRVPGAALAMMRAGEPLFASCYGMADLEWGNPVTPGTVFRLASLSKPFTALTVMLLAADGLLDLDAPITEYLPDYPERHSPVRVRHLLSHTSGIPNFVIQPGFQGKASRVDHTDEELVATFASQPLHFEPGSRYAYSNSGYRLLDMIAASAAGTSFAEVLTERVLAPAGMLDTRLLSDAAIVPARARGYQRGPDGFVNAPYLSMTIPGGAGGIGSTLADLQRFDRALRDGVLADAALQDRLFTPVRLTTGRTEDYGLGWAFSTYRGRRIIHHAGGIEGFSCLYLRIPEEDSSIILLTNLDSFQCTASARLLINTVLKLPPPERTPIPLPEPAAAKRVGEYTDTISVLKVNADAGGINVSLGDRNHRMVPLDPTTFVDDSDPDVVLEFHDEEPTPACTLRYPLWWFTGYLSR